MCFALSGHWASWASRPSLRLLVLSQIPPQLSTPKSSWPFNTNTILNLQQASSFWPSHPLTNVFWGRFSGAVNSASVWLYRWCFSCLSRWGLHFDSLLHLLSLAASDDYLFFPPSSTPTNIATIEAAKAQGTHWLCGPHLMSVFVSVIHPLNTAQLFRCVLLLLFLCVRVCPLFLYHWWPYSWLLLHYQCLLITRSLAL